MLARADIVVNSPTPSLARPTSIHPEVQSQPLAGAWARAKAHDRRRLRRIIGVVGLIACAGIIYLATRGDLVLTLGSLVGLPLIHRVLLPMMIYLFHRQGQAERGADAELNVAEALANDSENVLLLHNVAGPFGDLDHVVIRRSGAVIVIDTKSHPGRVTGHEARLQLNNRSFEKDILQQARRNAMWIKDQFRDHQELRIYVHACLAFPNAFVADRCRAWT